MVPYVTLSLVYVVFTSLTVIDGRYLQEDGACYSELGECSLNTYENVRLRSLKSSGCTKFCQCEYASTLTDGSVTYRWAEHACPAGLLFDEDISVCNWPQQVQCKANVEEDCKKEHGQCSKFTYEVTRLLALKSSGCERFCQCEHASTQTDGSVTYKWAEHACPSGLLFDETISVCNWPQQVQCTEDGNENDEDIGDDNDDGSITNPDDVNNSDGENGADDCEIEHGECTQFIYENIRLRALKSSGCTKFCQCEHASTQSDGSVTYRWAEHACASGLLFDVITLVCNWPQNVQCEANDVEDCEKEHGECTQSVYENIRLRALKSADCTKFCQCEHATTESDGSVKYRWAEHECASGLLFDDQTLVCNWAQNVQCEDNGGTDNGATDNGGTDNGGTDDGGNDNGGTDNGGNDNGGTDNGGNENGGTDSDGNNNGGTDDGNSDNGTDNGSDNSDSSDDNNGNENNDFECFKCYNSDSNEECNKKKEVCKPGEETCVTRVEWKGDTYEISKGCDNSDSSGSSDKSAKSSKESSSKSTTDESEESSSEDSSESSSKESAESSKEKSSKSSSSEEKSSQSSKEKSTKTSKEKSSKSSKEKSTKSSSEKSTKSSKEKSSKSSKETSEKSSKEKSSKSSKEKSTKSSKEKSTKSSKEKSAKSSKVKSTRSSKERSKRSFRERKSVKSTSSSKDCKKDGKKVTCKYECTSTLCNEFLPPMNIE